MSELLFPMPDWPTIPVVGQSGRFPVRRVFCVGRNYAAHAAEMGAEVDREAPFYFIKSPLAITLSGSTVPYAPGTQDLHHEMEFVVALGGSGFRVPIGSAMDLVFGYAAGLDMTRRDLQAVAKSKQRPWDLGKDFESSAIIGSITRAADFGAIGDQRISLSVNCTPRQASVLSDMVWSVPELIADLSLYYHLAPGDLIYTGTPAGVGAVVAGDRITGAIDGLDPIEMVIAPAE